MSERGLSPQWLQRLALQAQQPPPRPRLALCWHGQAVGSVQPEWLSLMAAAGGSRFFEASSSQVHCMAEDSAGLAELAQFMRHAQLAGPWRNELLSVVNDEGHELGQIERAAVRPLGLQTQAVHLVGQCPDGSVWVQQRALNKPNDPGMNDTLMGGMVSANDGLAGALARETWEEAGLHLTQLQQLRFGGSLSVQQATSDAGGMGYMRETLHWYACTLPEGVLPCNQDGEVHSFERLGRSELVQRLEEGRFTLEAALVLAAFLGGPSA
jgi:8-oxo-dGTP pyrophosphatase MutT (NUDIX family)